MQKSDSSSALVLGVFIMAGLAALGFLLGHAALETKQYERSVTVKGLSEREFDADVVIWPIQYSVASNELGDLYAVIEKNTATIRNFLVGKGIAAEEITFAIPAITDKSAQQYGNAARPEFRYAARQTVTVYSKNVKAVRAVMSSLSELGRQGIVFTGEDYQAQIEYLFTRLNDVKPDMIEESTRNAREVAEKFAADSKSKLGKIKRAAQGQFSIAERDKNNPHIKKVRVVSTVEYYLSD